MSIQEKGKDSKGSRETVTHLVSLAIKKEISWTILSPLINEMASTLEKSKEIIKILLIELENSSTLTQSYEPEDDVSISEELDNSSIVSNTEHQSDFDEDLVKEVNKPDSNHKRIHTDTNDQSNHDTILDESNFMSDDSFIESDNVHELLEENSEKDDNNGIQLDEELKEQLYIHFGKNEEIPEIEALNNPHDKDS